jgi:transcriptional regulator with GAF, ATPase, and Fis domain
LGVLAVIATGAKTFTRRDEDLIQAIIEPFSAALANDRRVHEIAALREAAEADRRSLLRRLGRTDLTDRIVGAEGGLSLVMKRVELVSQSDAPVLLLGETGTGKEVIARAVHDRSDRRDGPFIRVNCGAIPSELVDSQLFGHEKGAFTGAAEMRRGWFERADAGTLFLDEIGELPPDAQVRFLRVLQDAFIERVGGTDAIRVDVRVIAATHRDLASMVQEGRFREDLWYRIAVFPILLPPLRDRMDDIATLAEHFAQRAANRFGLSYVPPTASDIALLRRYPWPGNIRELGAVIDRAAILGEGRTLEIEAALGFSTQTRRTTRSSKAPTSPDGVVPLDDVMRQHIENSLRVTKGRIEGSGGAAKLLGINPHTLRSRMRKLGVDWTSFRSNKTADEV